MMALTVLHVLLATAGYMGIIASNAWLLALSRTQQSATVINGVSAWRKLVRIFGPILLAGVLAGFARALIGGISLTVLWLLGTYALIIVALVVQSAVMIPWQLRAESVLQRGGRVATRPIAVVLVLFCVVYAGIASLMLVKPG